MCCSPWGHKESDTTERLNNNKETNTRGDAGFRTRREEAPYSQPADPEAARRSSHSGPASC